MHEEPRTEQFKKKSKRPKAPPSLSIPDPVDIFKVEVVNRPPSVPIMGRRLSSESLLHLREDSPLIRSKLAFRKYRRKSIPDRLHKKPPIRKYDLKAKLLSKPSDLKPPLDRSSKVLQIKSSRNLIKKSNQSTPHMPKSKTKFTKVLISELHDKRKLDNNTPNKMTRKNSDGKECEEFKKSLNDLKNFIYKHEENAKNLKPAHKASKSVLSMRNEEKITKKVKKNQDNNRVSPPKKRTGKKVEQEKSNSHSKAKRVKEVKTNKTKRKLSSEAGKKVVKVKEFKEIKKISKKIKKKVKKKEKSGDKFLDHSFFLDTKGKQVDSLELGDVFEDQIQVHGSDLQSSNDLHLSIPSNEDRLSKISSIPGTSLPESIRPRSPIPFDSLDRSTKSKLIKIPKAKKLTPSSAATKIQKVFRGYLVRRAINQYKSFTPIESGFISIENQCKVLTFNGSFNNLNFSEDDEVNKIFKDMHHKDLSSELAQNRFYEDFYAGYEENIDKSDYQAPKPAEIQNKPRSSPQVSNLSLAIPDLPRSINKEVKINDLEKDSKDIENLIYLDSLKIKKANIEDLRKRDLEAIKKLTPKSGSESEIFQIFQNIINRRYETINSMFDDNIKAVQEALAQSVVSEESFSLKPEPKPDSKDFPLQTTCIAFIPSGSKSADLPLQMSEQVSVKSVNFNTLHTAKPNSQLETRFYRNLEKCAQKPANETRTKSPELVSPNLQFKSNPIQMTPIAASPEPALCSIPQLTKPEHKSSKIVWIDEVAMPSNINLSDLIVESCISELYSILFDDVLCSFFIFSPAIIADLSDELIFAILSHEVQEKVLEMKKDFDEEAILNVIQKIFIKTQNLIVTELLKPLEKDPLAVLAEIQEVEIGCGFLPEEKYAMLNIEAFNEDLGNKNEAIRVFNMMIFDCINESLERLLVKEDLPWATVRYKKVVVKNSEEVINYIVNRLIKLNEIAAGEIGFDLNRAEVEVSQKREFDILKMMAVDVIDEEADWVRYDKEELQAKLDLADMILEQEIDDIFELVF